jgi:Spy/CpxP family protein refolding chaperone
VALFVLGMLCGAMVLGGFIRQASRDGNLGLFLYGLGPQRTPPQPTGMPGMGRDLSDPRRSASQLLGRLTKRLNLTDEQKKKIEPLLQDSARQLRAVQEDTRQHAKEIITSTQEKIQAELTPEQQAEYARMREEQGKRLPFLNGRRNGPFSPANNSPGNNP